MLFIIAKMAELTKLKLKRGNIKGQLTRISTFYDTVDPEHLTEYQISQLKTRLDRAEPLLSQFEDVQGEIESGLCESEQDFLETEGKEREEFEQQYFDIISKIKLLVIDKSEAAGSSVHSVGLASNIQQPRHSIKLPNLKLPTFNGSYEKWLEFRDAFQAIVHKNTFLSDVEKFYYLKSYLEGEPLQAIANLQVTNDNFLVAWTLLTDRYENKRLIVHNYVKALFDCPSVVKETHCDLRSLYDLFNKNLRSLKSLGQDTDNWDTLIVYLITSKFDSITRREWESYPIPGGELPKMTDVNAFLKTKCELLEKLESSKKDSNTGVRFDAKNKLKGFHATVTEGKFSCYYCRKPHSIYKCFAFKNLHIKARIAAINKLKICSNCFDPAHSGNCPKNSSCRVCGNKHNTLLHLPEITVENRSPAGSSPNDMAPSAALPRTPPANISMSGHSTDDQALNESATLSVLSTAVIRIFDSKGDTYLVRALLDPGSQSNFITDSLATKLNLSRSAVNYQIMGVGEALSTIVDSRVNVTIMSNINEYTEAVSCLVIKKITRDIPTISFDISNWDIPRNLRLADKSFNIQGDIDILLGVNVFYRILLMKQIRKQGLPVLQKTRLGWVIGGNTQFLEAPRNQVVACLSLDQSIDENLTKFWEIEECSNTEPVFSKSEQFCEQHFEQNYRRNSDGRFIVKFPFKKNIGELGSSKEMALQRLKLLERRLRKNEGLKRDYVDFMNEYINMGHMSKVKDFSIYSYDTKLMFYLPHHPVIRECSLTTKVRVVFDASAKTDTGLSLNDVQFSGPTIQRDLLSILLRFRIYPYVLNADISKMYRQVLIDPSERSYQRILWKNPDCPQAQIECFELNTVTYGCASSPFLAVRCLTQLALDFQTEYPEASEAILNCFYLDDLLTGAFSASDLLRLQRDISFILDNGGFQLRKWLCNKPELLDYFEVHKNLSSSILHLGENEQSKTLGIFWNAANDTIHYSIKHFNVDGVISKRMILSVVSQIFDPLGLLGPVVVTAKLLLQFLWQEKLSWDEPVPSYISSKWLEFCKGLQLLNRVNIGRYVLSENWEVVHLHGFADASEKAYGGCIYIVSLTSSYEYSSSKILLSKSRVAPIKKISLPRLELCAAVLTCKLMQKVKQSIKLKIDNAYFWTDSLITLCWIKGCPSRWKTFVANRVTQVQNMSNSSDWFHVRSGDNPADCLSRGISSESLLNSKLWWEGPTHLFPNINNLDMCIPKMPEDMPEQRVISHTVYVEEIPNFDFSRYSSLVRVQRVFAYCIRFIEGLRNKNVAVGPLTAAELNKSLIQLVKVSQEQSFAKDYYLLKNKRPLLSTSNILCLKPFCDEMGMIRVGGRIHNAIVSNDQKHPYLLHNKHHLTTLIMHQVHIKLLHCGPQQLLYSVREQFWPLSGRQIARTIVRNCVRCFKSNPTTTHYVMGNLPEYRVTPFQPVFTHTGVDYAGPISLRDRKTRNPKILKGYICIFICMNTKCVHIDVVSDLTSQAFLAVLKRFIARRGKPLHFYSDNGTTFVGANSMLQKHLRSNCDEIVSELSSEGITWHFMPPRAPNFGGLWEAGVKSVKFHLKRVIGNTSLTYEDLSTVLTQIEGVLNSRPLSPLSSDPQDLTPLTPAHFLVGKTLTSLPEDDFTTVVKNRLSKFQHLQSIVQQFWKRWNREYISEMQTRTKWKKQCPSLLKVGSLVVIKENNLPIYQWRTGRVIELHSGSDNVTRVVTVQCSDGSMCKRAVSKLCVLPIATD